jgi:hypothetical protein
LALKIPFRLKRDFFGTSPGFFWPQNPGFGLSAVSFVPLRFAKGCRFNLLCGVK